jgi:ribosomal protein L3 glutamine methyltransferase
MTLHALLAAAAERLQAAPLFYGHGTQSAPDEAAWLVLWRLGLPLDTDVSEGSEAAQREVAANEEAAVWALIAERIATRKPAAYLTREAWLQGVPFYVDERAIVPRSYIAELIAQDPDPSPDPTQAEGPESLDPWLGPHTQRVLDLCTGNGSLAVLAALAWPDVQVDASDISPDALAVARINVERHGLQDRIRLLESDGWQAISGSYDLILCNPPYVSRAAMQSLPAEYRAEPALALDGGTQGAEDGMDFVRHLLAQAAAHMNEGAVLVLEIGNERAHFERAFPRLEAYWPDTSVGTDPVVLLTREALQSCLAQPGGQP